MLHANLSTCQKTENKDYNKDYFSFEKRKLNTWTLVFDRSQCKSSDLLIVC